MARVNGFDIEVATGLVPLLDLAMREVQRSFGTEHQGPLRGSQYRVLSMMPRHGGRRLTDLATIADMTKQAMGEFVADLADGGYVTVEPDPADRRAKLVSLTSAGQEAADHARWMLSTVDAIWSERLGARDLAQLKALLARVSGVS
jgi:DNA-binding MarR family transcriptional regulator